MWLPPEHAIVRQIVLNSAFDVIITIDPPDERYQDPVIYMSSPEYDKQITWDNIAKFDPFLEILIVRILYGSASERPQPAKLAAEILRNSDLAKQLGLTGDGQLEDQVLNRTPKTYFPKKKRVTRSKRPRIESDDKKPE